MSNFENEINVNYVLMGLRLNALKAALTEEQLVAYNNYITDKLKDIEPNIRRLISPEKADEVLKVLFD